ncbi:hypothetical protein, partial [Burkholderia cenocepacia]|uniref:hypothetical protein n=1 Tax=Burkholderia cenocepacia TaxID=95486 RepID=UPI00223106DF
DCSAIDFRQSSEFRRRAAGDITLSMRTAYAEQNITLAVLVNIASTPLGTASIDCELLQFQPPRWRTQSTHGEALGGPPKPFW